jgi:hypothetical protein
MDDRPDYWPLCFKLMAGDSARIKQQNGGIKYAERALTRHNIDFKPLFFPYIAHPPRDRLIENFVPEDIPKGIRPLNEQQMEAAGKVRLNCNS